jgi:hypothetical protein
MRIKFCSLIISAVIFILQAEDALKLGGYLDSKISYITAAEDITTANALFRLEGNYDIEDRGKVEVHLLYYYDLQPLDPFSGFKNNSIYSSLSDGYISGMYGSLDPESQEVFAELMDIYNSASFSHFAYSSYFPKERLVMDRALVKLYSGNFDLVFGKQQIAWGTGYAFNPTDVWNIKDPLDPEGNRIGVTALNLTYFFGENSSLNMIGVPGSNFDHWRYGARIKSNLGRYEYSFSGIRDKSDDGSLLGLPERIQLGADFAGETIFDIGVFGEGALSDSLDLQLSAGIDYTFENGLYFLGEYYYNGLGENNYKSYDFDSFVRLTGGVMSGLARNYLANYLSYTFLNDYTASFLTAVNLDDSSAVFVPGIEYAFHPNILLNLNCSVFAGSSGKSEYGGLLNKFSFGVKGYF